MSDFDISMTCWSRPGLDPTQFKLINDRRCERLIAGDRSRQAKLGLIAQIVLGALTVQAIEDDAVRDGRPISEERRVGEVSPTTGRWRSTRFLDHAAQSV